MSDTNTPSHGVGILVRDLMFSSKITAEARAAGISFKLLRDPAGLSALPEPIDCLIVDLNLPGAIDAAAAWRLKAAKPVIGFVSHVDLQTIQAAKAAGIDQVLPRSRFVQLLPEILRQSIPNRSA